MKICTSVLATVCLLILSLLCAIPGSAQVPEVLYYKFTNTGTSVANLASNPPAGTETATILGNFSQGAGGKCEFGLIGSGSEGGNNYMNTNWAPNLGTGDWTISFWINNVTNYTQLWYIFGDVNTNSFRCFTNGVAGPDNYILRGGGLNDVQLNGAATSGEQYIVFVYDSSVPEVRAYLNGTLGNTVSQTGAAVNLTGTGPFKVGAYTSSNGLASGSVMDEFAFYDRALSASEIQDKFNNPCVECYVDADGDGFGDPNSTPLAKENEECPMGYVDNNLDCDDNDENTGAIQTWYLDNDEDGYYTGDSILACYNPGPGYTNQSGLLAGDCDDENDLINPGQQLNICNGLDNNCNGAIDAEEVEVSEESCSKFIGFSPFQDSLWVIDTFDMYNIIDRAAPSMAGFTITGINGAAKNPLTNAIFVICKVSGVSGRVLGTINPTTYEVTQVGNLGDNFASITFGPDGKLYGVTGDGASVPETLYEIDPSNASKTLLTALGNGADGEVICFNPDDNHIYHWSGNGTPIFEKVLPVPPYTVTGILSGASGGEIFGAAYLGNGKFLTSNISSSFSFFYTNGTQDPTFGSTPDDLRGLPFLNCNTVCYLDADGDGYGDATQSMVSIGLCPEGYVTNSLDCNDDPLTGVNVYPCAIEICDGIDNDCNGLIDDGAQGGTSWTQNSVGVSEGEADYPICGSEEGDNIDLTATGMSTNYVDGMQLVSQTICGDGSITAQVTNMTGLGWAGITFRETMATGSKKVVLKMQMNGNVRREIRTTTNGATSFLNMFRFGHSWLRIVRQGNTFTGYTSPNGVTWTVAFSAVVSMNSCVQVGVQVESINQAAVTTASFSNVIVIGNNGNVTRPITSPAQLSQSFEVFPNPSSQDIYLEIPAGISGLLECILLDIHGRVLSMQTLEQPASGKIQLSIPTVTDGMYFLQIKVDDALIQTNRVVFMNTGN